MYCGRCGNGLGEEQVCHQCGWSLSGAEMYVGEYERPSTGDGAALTSLVCGVLSWMTCGGFGMIPIVGIIFGMIGLKSRQSEIAVAGIVINAAVLILAVLFIALSIIGTLSGAPVSPAGGSGGRCC